MNHVSLDIKLFMYIFIRSVLWNDQTCVSLNIFRILQFLFLKKSKNKKMLFNIRLYYLYLRYCFHFKCLFK